jgi:hypothetical protein
MPKKKVSKAEAIANPARLKWQVDMSTWSMEKKQNEYNKCKADPAYWMYNYGVIAHPTRGKIQFKLFDFQAELVRTMFESKNVVVLKSRQLGISTLLAAFCCWLSVFYPDKFTLVIATKANTAKNFLEKVKVFFQYTPKFMKPGITEWNKFNLTMTNGSRIEVSTTTADAGRSAALSLLVVDEAAFIPELATIMTAAAPTISTGGKAIMLSTPNGTSGFFYETCMLAKEYQEALADGRMTKVEEKTSYKLVTLPWDLHPERDQDWYINMCKTLNNSKQAIAQELNCSFEGSGNTVVPHDDIEWLRRDKRKVNCLSAEEFNKELDHMMTQYLPDALTAYNISDPVDMANFIQDLTILLQDNLGLYKKASDIDMHSIISAGVDVSTGGGADFSTFVAFDDTTNSNIVTFKAKVNTKIFAIVCYLLGRYLNNAVLYIERNTGYDLLLRLDTELQYENIYVDNDRKLGFLTTAKNRPVLIGTLTSVLCNPSLMDRPIINDSRITSELDTFVWTHHGRRAEAAQGKNDDLTIAMLIAFYGMKVNMGQDPLGILPNEMPIMTSQEIMESLTKTLDINKPYEEDEEVTLWQKLNSDGSGVLEQNIKMWDMFGIEHGQGIKKHK